MELEDKKTRCEVTNQVKLHKASKIKISSGKVENAQVEDYYGFEKVNSRTQRRKHIPKTTICYILMNVLYAKFTILTGCFYSEYM